MGKIKVIAYSPIHYGAEYLKESLMSVINHVDKIVAVYSETPSYGHGTTAECPEKEMDLFKIAMDVCGDKLIWRKEKFHNEGEHRSFIYNFTEGFDLVLALDADEVFKEADGELDNALRVAYEGDKRYYGIAGYLNFWKSFSHICTDGFTPIRITNLKNKSGEGVVPCTIYHFSCAQSNVIMDYKYEIHGHKNEIRDNWLQNIYYKWTPENQFKFLHPTSMDIWGEAIPFDKNTLPESLKNHPNFNKHIII
ncbi:MAG: hypothetical protein AABY22_22945 [Nanoarchaeota archaeon]